MYDILFLSRTIPDCVDETVRAKMQKTMDDAAIAWQNHILYGIDSITNNSVTMANYLPVKSWPKYYRDPFIKMFTFSHNGVSTDVNLPFCNIQFAKRFFQKISLIKYVKKWAITDTEKEKIIIAYSLYPEFVEAIATVKKVNPKIKSCSIVLDLPKYCILTEKISFYSKLYLMWSEKQAKRYIKSIDSFALLTKHMAKALSVEKFTVIEGIASDEFKIIKDYSILTPKVIFYAGTLHRRFGVLELLKAFSLLPDKDCELWLCGYGDAIKDITASAVSDHRIKFLGQKKRSEVLELMSQASIIVNPRTSDESFAMYSFPSKNLEALSTGIPFIGNKLPGIPDEYDKYINYPSDSSPETMQRLFSAIFDDYNPFLQKALDAQKWVFKQKNSLVQAKKILELIEKE